MNRNLKIVVTGPESVGKTELAALLAEHYNCRWVPEFAREYIENLNRPYTLDDVKHVASVQIKQSGEPSEGIVIFDTWLIITRVWMDVVYGVKDEEVDRMINSGIVDLFLLCEPDIPWYPDAVRENGGEARQVLYERYLREIKSAAYPVRIVSGTGEQRLQSAIFGIENFLKSREI